MSLSMHCRALILAILCGCLLSSCTLAPAPASAPAPTAPPTPPRATIAPAPTARPTLAPQLAPPTPPQAATITSEQLAQMEQQWNDQHLTSYRMALQIRGSFVTEQWSISVQDGQVRSATCLSDRCSGYTLADHASHTVAGLFDRIRAALHDGDEITLAIDGTYHFPQRLKIVAPHIADAQIAFEVTTFEPASR
jgi:uncharacterized protein DUF6174